MKKDNWNFKYLSILIVVAITSISTEAQKIAGHVKDAKTLEPLPFANIFLNNTTIGTVTDAQGDFVLVGMSEPGGYEVVFSFVGYESHKMKINFLGTVINVGDIKLMPLEVQLGEVAVSATRDKEWEKKLKKFKKIFLGEDKQAALCTIENPWVIDFPTSRSKDVFEAKANAPIEITNRALGYKVIFYLADFRSTRNAYVIAGDARFTEIASSDLKESMKWQLNRQRSYDHSPHHLFKSIIQNRIKSEGFNLFTESAGFEKATTRSESFYSELGKTMMNYDTNGMVVPIIKDRFYKIYLKSRVEIHYTKERANRPIYTDVSGPVSWISINKDFVVVNQDGFPKNPSDVVVSGDMSIGRVANMLPLDYHPTRGQNVLDHSDLSFYQEQIYIQTDKPYYYPGETIWFKGYMNYQMPAWRDSLSRTVYVELIDRTKQAILSSKIVRIDSGFFHNDFVVPNTLIEGNIYLRAYTLLNRNFGDRNLYVKPIPIIKMNNRVIANSMEVEAKTEGNIFRIPSIKKSYKPKEEIKLIFSLSEDDEPLASNFSVAITDLSQVAPLEISKTILNSYPLRILDADLLKAKLRYPVEFGINFSGKFTSIHNKPIGTLLQVVQLDPPNYTMTQSNREGIFTVNGLVFYDTTRFLLRPASTVEKEGRIEFKSHESPFIDFNEKDPIVPNVTTDLSQRDCIGPVSIKGTRELEGIEIRAAKLEVEKSVDRVSRPYGRPDFILRRKDINTSYGNLLQTLQGKIPGLIVRQVNNQGEGIAWFVYLNKSGSSSFLNPVEVLVTINDVVVTGKPEQILSAIDPNTVESVEVKTGINVLYGSLGGNGIVAIYTRKDIGNQESKIINSPTMMNVIGYSRPRKFNHVNYSGTSPFEMDSKCKSTIYWNPIVKTDAIKGTATISFYASDVAGKYRLVAEGVTEKGEPIRCVYIIEISNE